MEHVRVSVITTDPHRLADAVKYIDEVFRPLVEAEPGSRGLAVATNDELGVAVTESFWVSHDAMRDSERAVAPVRDKAVLRGDGTVSAEQFEVSSTLRVKPAHANAGVRLTRYDFDPRDIDDGITAYEDVAWPWMAEAPGLCRAFLFVHRRSGRAIGESVWRDTDALAASRSKEAAVRVDVVAATDAQVRALEEFRLASTSSGSA
jgi:hypothetical protein